MEVKVDVDMFWQRLMKLHKTWNGAREKEGLFKGADALVVDTGTANEDELYSKSAALQTWLLGYEFPDTCIAICSRNIYVLTSSKKVQHLQPLINAENATLPLELLVSEKKAPDKNKAKYQQLVAAIKASHSGEKPEGDFAKLHRSSWRDELGEAGLEQVELAPALADIMASKDTTEQACLKRAAIFSAVVMQKHVVQKLEAARAHVVDEEKKISHEKLAEETEDAFSEPAKLGVKLSPEYLESCYTPIIQSGGKFDLKPSAFSNAENLYYGTITCSLGARYKSYCSNVGRTYIINPSKGQEKNYKLLLELQQTAVDALKPDAKLSAVYAAVANRLKSKAPHLEGKLTKRAPRVDAARLENVGFATGLEFRESAFQLNAKSEQPVFNLAVGLDDLEDKDATDARGKKYALFLADTVLVKEEGAAEVLTERAPKQWGDMSYYLKDDEEEAAEPGATSKGKGNVEIMNSRTRGAGKQHEANQEALDALNSHQAELEEKMRLDALERLQNTGGPKDEGAAKTTAVAYRDPNQYPTASSSGGPLKTHQTFVDGKQESVLVPIHGRLVPFHISNVKNVSKSEEGGWTFLRINFVAPGPSVSAAQLPVESADAAHWIREVTLKARVPTNLNNTFRLIKELRKRVTQREKEVAEQADLVAQEDLQLIRTGKVHRLRDVNVRPNVGGKKAPGTLELHATGLRFQAARGEKLDLIFKNVKLAFFQPAEKEILVIMHFHLHHPIMIGKKKTRDVQFYVEVMEASYSLDQTRRSGYDPDELEEEQRERAMRARMNQEFQNFVKKIEEQARDLEFDIPYRDLGFYGVPNKSTCFIMPAVNALVELTEPPWLVVALNDIEVAHFERVVYGLKNFDLVLVLKDFSVKPLQINSINMEHLEPLKSWLDSCNIKFYEGTANLNWTQIMKHVNEIGGGARLEGFYDDGGWKFLNMQGSSDDEEGGESDAESEFEPSGSEEEEDDDDEESEGSDFVDSDEGSGEESLGSDESSGEDWDEAEKRAAEKDKRKGQYEEDEGRPKNKGKGKKRSKGDYSEPGSDSDDGARKPPPKKSKQQPLAPRPGGSSSGLKKQKKF